MKKITLLLLPLALLVVMGITVYSMFSAFSGCAWQQNSPMGFGRMGPGPGPGRMHTASSSVQSEYDFLVHMIPHHEEAVSAAEILKENTEREEMKQFAETIITTQTEEIEQMQTWLATWYPERDHDAEMQPMMRDLEGLEGDELDRAFLEDMIPHHMEAVMMSQQLLNRRLAEHEEVALLARDIRDNQRDEIHMMMNWIHEWYDDVPYRETSRTLPMMRMGLVGLTVIIALAIMLTIVVYMGSTSKSTSGQSARALLDNRYARGEMSREEYREKRKSLEE